MAAQRILFIFTYGSYLRAAMPIARYMQGEGDVCDYILYDLGDGAAQIGGAVTCYPALKENYQTVRTLAGVLTSATLQRYDAVFFAFGGRELRTALGMFYASVKAMPKRPAAVTLFPGIFAPRQWSGLSARCRSDMILFNNAHDLAEYQALQHAAGTTYDNARLFGMPALYNSGMTQRAAMQPSQWKNVYFVDQAVLPRTQEDRQSLCDFLLAYARRFPQRNLIILMKNAPDSVSAHMCGNTVAERLKARAGKSGLPANLSISFAPVQELFADADFCMSISSSVMLECIALGISVAPIADFGFSFTLGNEGFRACGCALTFEELLNDRIGSIDPIWASRYLAQSPEHLVALRASIASFQSSARQDDDLCSQADMLIEYVRTQKRAAFQQLPLKTKIYKMVNRQKKRMYRMMGMKTGRWS